MGQLEKYGLYVLCLVIFLILGVAIMGEPAAAYSHDGGAATSQDQAEEAGMNRTASAAVSLGDLQALMGPAPRPVSAGPRPEVGSREDEGDRMRDGGGANDRANDGANPEPESSRESRPESLPERAVEPPATRQMHVIRAGDTLSEIAQKRLGSARFVSLLEKLNPGVRPERLPLGKQLQLPSVAELALASGPSKGLEAGSVTYRIKRGDTLEGLAKSRLGDARRVRDIKRLNPTVDPTRLRIGQIVYLPAR